MSTTLLRGGRLVQDGCITRCDILLCGKAVDAVLPPDSGAAADFVYDLAGLYVSASPHSRPPQGGAAERDSPPAPCPPLRSSFPAQRAPLCAF